LFPVQYGSFRNIYNREDLIVRDLTGSGKTLAFSLPIVEYLRANKLFGTGQTQAIILAPTRELALQIARTLSELKHHDNEYKVITVYGGTSINDQAHQLRKGVDIFVGTTGRVLDHLNRGNLRNFSQLKAMILDEADQMLNMGFKEDVDKILEKIKESTDTPPQFLLFSATVPGWINNLANNYLRPNWKMIDLAKNLKDKT
jgi:ATP-dependent RNA helicase DDX21